MSKVTEMTQSGAWEDVKASARTTIGRTGSGKTPDDAWKKTILLAEHSPIRRMRCFWVWEDLKTWVSVHFVRHKIGIEHWVSTQRTDRTGIDRSGKSQDAPVRHACEADMQAMINISRKRLCSQASNETRMAWYQVIEKLKEKDPVAASVMVPECIYRGFCPEFRPCGYCDTPEFQRRLEAYRKKN